MTFLKEDEITEIFIGHLTKEKWKIISAANGHTHGADIIAKMGKRTLCIEAKGGGSQTLHSRRYGKPFTRLQCHHHTDVAFACIPRMIARYSPDYVGIVLHDDKHHLESIQEILPAIKKLGAGAWLVGEKGIRVLNKPKLQEK